MDTLQSLLDDLEWTEGMLQAYDGDGNKVRNQMRAKIAEITGKIEPFLAKGENDTEAAPIEMGSVHEENPVEDTPVIYSQESA
jgi:hypothetical protein